MKNSQSGQKGFTIIELVVVILLLGILAATALPRFIDVSDEARTAVAQSTAAAVATGAALYRAEWVAEGEPAGTAPGDFTETPNANGYPEASDATECEAVYVDLLQANAPEATATYDSDVCTFDLGDGSTFTYNTLTSDVSVP